MSEYQFIHFKAIDRALDDDALEFMRRQSSRADVSRWEFTNEYHYGDFHGRADEMLRRGYDVHLHFANYGIRKLKFRLPQMPCSVKEFNRFGVDVLLDWNKDKSGSAGILTVIPEGDGDPWDYLTNPEEFLDRIAPVREMLMQGDLRPLYLFWLATCFDEDRAEPPVPAGLGECVDGGNDALDAIAEFYEIPTALLQAAAEKSQPTPDRVDQSVVVQDWLKRQTKTDLQKTVEGLLLSDGSPRVLVNDICRAAGSPEWPMTPSSRTRKTLDELATEAERVQTEKEEAARQAIRDKELKSIAKDPQKTIRRIDSCVATRQGSGYREAASHLKDLGDALGREFAEQHLQKMMERYSRYTSLKRELRAAGFEP